MKEKIVLKYKKENDLSEQKLTLNDRVDNIFKSGWVNEITYLSNLMQDTRVCLLELRQENKQLKEEIEEYKRIEQEDLKAFNNYDSILIELEEWLKGRIEWNKSILEEDKGKSDLLGFNFNREAYIKMWEDTLNKIQELKEKYK